MNQVVLIGRLTKDPEPGVIPGSGSSTSKFTIAVNRDYKDKEGKIDYRCFWKGVRKLDYYKKNCSLYKRI